MALRDLLVYVDQSNGAAERLRLTADLARRHASRLTAIFVNELNQLQLHDRGIAELGLGSAQAMAVTNQRIRQSILDRAEQLQSILQEIQRAHGIEVEWRCLDGVASAVVPQHARFADLCVLSQDVSASASAAGYTFSEELLFVSGRPVIFIPAQGSFDSLGRHILISWNSSRASARALNDALPLVERAERVTVLAVNPAAFADRYRALPPQHLVEHLKRHGANAEGVWLNTSASIADTILSEARKINADLIVAGAFGHPKLWEKLLGGVTRDLLARMNVPVFMSY